MEEKRFIERAKVAINTSLINAQNEYGKKDDEEDQKEDEKEDQKEDQKEEGNEGNNEDVKIEQNVINNDDLL